MSYTSKKIENNTENGDGENPYSYLSMGSYANRHFKKEFYKLKDASLFNRQTRSYIEQRIQNELFSLQSKSINKYGYRDDEESKARSRMMGDIKKSGKQLYASLTQALSKYSVLVRDMDKLPTSNANNLNWRGVYAK